MGLDGVQLVMAWEESFGLAITDAEGAQLLTPRHAIDLIYRKLAEAGSQGPGGCLTQRAFHRVRAALRTAFAAPRHGVRPDTPVETFFPAEPKREQWRILQAQLGIPFLPRWFLFSPPSGCRTVGDLASRLVACQPATFRHEGEPWTRAQVRSLVRLLIVEQLAIEEFSDDDEFVRDLRVD